MPIVAALLPPFPSFAAFIDFLLIFLEFMFTALNQHFTGLWLLPLFFIGLFSQSKATDPPRLQQARGFFQFSFVFVCAMVFLMLYLAVYPVEDWVKLDRFLFMFYWRLYEQFMWFWVCFIVLGLGKVAEWGIWVVARFPRIEKGVTQLRFLPLKKMLTEKRALFYACLLMVAAVNYAQFADHQHYESTQYRDNQQTEAVMWVANYFTEYPPSEPTAIYGEPVERGWLYVLLPTANLSVRYVNNSMLGDYGIFLSAFTGPAQYCLINRTNLEAFGADNAADFTVRYENQRYLFLERIS